MTLENPIGPPPNHYDPAWISRFWAWVTKVFFLFGRDADGNIDHGQTGGLTDDDHTQYVHRAPSASSRNTVGDLTADVVLLTLNRDSLTPHTADVLQVLDSVLAVLAKITSTGKVYGFGLDAADQKITNVGTPTLTDDAANKVYVDGLVPQAIPTAAAKGDILAFNGSTWEIVPVGTDGQFLTADSGASAGVSWT